MYAGGYAALICERYLGVRVPNWLLVASFNLLSTTFLLSLPIAFLLKLWALERRHGRPQQADRDWRLWFFGGYLGPQAPRRLMGWLRIAWHLFVNVVVFAVAYSIFAAVTAHFETIVVALLSILWVGVRSAHSVLHNRLDRYSLYDDVRHCRLLELLNDPGYQSEDEKQRTTRDQAQKAVQLQEKEWCTMIDELGWAALFLFAAYKLFLAVYPAAVTPL